MEKRLQEFINEEYALLFDFPLYSNILIKTEFEREIEYEPLFDHENSTDPYAVVEHSSFLENKDFQTLKRVFFKNELKKFHFCPYCDKEVPIVYKGVKTLPEEFNTPVLATTTNISSEEEYNAFYLQAQKKFEPRYRTVNELLFGESGILNIELTCTAQDKHKFSVFFKCIQEGQENYITKIGQYPSVKDFDDNSKRYKNILKDKITIKELNKSIGLKSHGVGVGSFVYLRRIFERLIYDEFEEFMKENPNVQEKNFIKLKMKEKIEYLKDYLPTFLVNNKNLYGILSIGIHELSEEECLNYFDTVYAAIIHILEQKLKKVEERRSIKEVENALRKISTKN